MITFRWEEVGDVFGKLVLDLGSGTGRHVRALAQAGANVVAGDIDIQVEEAPGGRVRLDGHRLPFRDGAFDMVVVAEVLEHVRDPKEVLAECARITRSGGSVVASAPRWYPEAVNWALSLEYHSVPGGHIRIICRSQLGAWMQRAGLVVEATHHSHALHTPYWWYRCITGIEDGKDSAGYAWFNRILLKEMGGVAPTLTALDRALNPLCGKSIVMYGRKR